MDRLFLLLTAALVLWTAPAGAVTFEVPVQGSRSLTVAVDTPATPSGDPDGLSEAFTTALRRDLDLTGYFELVDPDAHIERGAGVQPGTFDYGDWKLIRAAALVKPRILPASDPSCDRGDGKACVDVYVYDVYGQALLTGKRLRAPASAGRALAHEAANVVLMALVGEPGFFSGHLVAVRARGEGKQVVVLDVDGSNPRPLTRNGSLNLSPAWSPDGRRVAFTSYKRGDADVYVKDLSTGEVDVVSARPGVDLSPAFSPDGRTMVVARTAEADTDLFLVDATTGEDIRQLTSGGGIDVSPCFTPDGREVVFASERGGGSSIYAVPVTGGSPRRVTPFKGFFTDPVVSPDGSTVAFVANQGSFDVLTARMDGTGLRRITQDAGDNEDPTWSPDGRYLVFTSTRTGRSQLWLSTADGRHQVALTTSGGWSQPAWRP